MNKKAMKVIWVIMITFLLFTNLEINNLEWIFHCFETPNLTSKTFNERIEILSEEIGDLFWYVCALMYEYDLDFIHILIQNIEKRKKRYPNGFNPLDSLLRKDKDNE